MSTIEINQGALHRLLRADHSPAATYTARKVQRVADRAKSNAQIAGFRPEGRIAVTNHPPTPYMRTQDLVNDLRARGPFSTPQGPYWLVGSAARHKGILYPRLLEKGGFAVSWRSTSGFMYYRYPYLEPAIPPDFVRVG